MSFGPLRRWRRNRILRREPIAEGEWAVAFERLPWLRRLDSDQRARLRDWAVLYLHHKVFEPAGGVVLERGDRLMVAVQACVPILGLDPDWYENWSTVIVYPAGFLARHRYRDETGLMHEEVAPLVGEAWESGPLVLSREDIDQGPRTDGFNVVIHEHAHKLDMLNGAANGMPPLHRGMSRRAWTQAFAAAFDDLGRRLDHGRETTLDSYAAQSPAEFFAVASELFFELPLRLRSAYPDVYRQMTLFYRQDPAG